MNSTLKSKRNEVQVLPQDISSPPEAKRLISSNFFWIVVALISTELFLYIGRPLKFVHVQGTMLKDHDYVGSKINGLLANPLNNDSLVIGDSTADSLCSYADMSAYKTALTSDSKFGYLKARLAENLLQKELAVSLNIRNLYFGGCLISDQALMLEKLLERGNHPKLVFLTLVPRPFIDPTVDPKISPVNCFFENRYKGLENVKDFQSLAEHFLNTYSNIYRTHSDYKTILSSLACSNFNRPLNAYVQNGGTGINQKNKVFLSGTEEKIDPDQSGSPQSRQEEMSYYKKAYVFNEKVFNYQYQRFTDMVKLLSSKNINFILIKLPLGKTNLNLLDPEISQIINKKIQKSANKARVPLIDLQTDSRFNEDDFKDSVHLTGAGGIKVWHAIASEMKKYPEFQQKLKVH